MAAQYEYKVVLIHDEESATNELNGLAADGWRVAHPLTPLQGTLSPAVILEREIPGGRRTVGF